ncbi:MAG TPA: NAD(P)-binding domain-containing protein [Longimicrobiales bacterium]|nr:NAD(P)-binding domain-containing protein [Longimicrobiales bacterium]
MVTDAVVVGAGHAGLAMSRCLAERSIDHVVLERGEVANSWKKERWDSLRLLTPNWQSRLPGYRYEGEDPDGFRTMPETVAFIERYARVISAPVRTQTSVTSLSRANGGYRLQTDQGTLKARAVVIATGACNVPRLPCFAEAVPSGIDVVTPNHYRNPGQLAPGGVLVVGASATGTQIADEIHRSGRPVTLAVGEHIRVPRVYRGRDIERWMDEAGVLDDPYDEADNLQRVRSLPSLQLTGSDDGHSLDLNALTRIGVRLVGRLAAIQDGHALFSGSLRNLCALSDLKMNRLLDRIDEWVRETGLESAVPPPHRFEPTRVDASPPLDVDLRSGEIRTVVWATGFRPDYSWLDVPVLDRKARLIHDGGVVDAPGLYVIGLPYLRRLRSSLIDGAAADAEFLCSHLARYLDREARA